ncbi:MAG: hypothetical protein RID18_16200 [Cytophagales bacterium]
MSYYSISSHIKEFLRDRKLISDNKTFSKCILLTRSRTGSNMLIDALGEHPSIIAHSEIFKGAQSIEEVNEAFSKIYGNVSYYCNTVIFKVFYYHPYDANLNSYLFEKLISDKSYLIIHLKRRNILRMHLSRKIAEKTKSYIYSADRFSVNKSVEISIEELTKVYNETMNHYQFVNDHFSKHGVHEVFYEDLIKSRVAFDDLLNFLNMKKIDFKTQLRKQNPEELRDLISNFDYLKKRCSGSHFEAYFD